MRMLVKILIIIICAILILTLLTYCSQEKLIFHPSKLAPDYKYEFETNYTEYFIDVDEDVKLNGLLFKADTSNGLVFYLHGNAGAMDGWGKIAELYLGNNYDIFILDYRGFGKSQGKIKSEKQLFADVQTAYDNILKKYNESDVIIIGFSIGTGMAAKLAADNNPKMLILKAPYYSLTDLIQHYYKIVPGFLIKYKLRTNEYIQNVKAPIVIFHGDSDDIIYYNSSVKLSKLLKDGDKFITLPNGEHNGMNDNPDYRKHLTEILGK